MRVNYKHSSKVNRKDKKKKRLQQALNEKLANKEAGSDNEGSDIDMEAKDRKTTQDKLEEKGLTKTKRKQIFKKYKTRDVKAQIVELRLQSKKLKKKDISQKAEKGKIAKQIKELKASIKNGGEEQDSD